MGDEELPALKEVFLRALELPEPERWSFLAGACGDDEELRAKLEKLLRAHEGAGEFLADPTFDFPPQDVTSPRSDGDVADVEAPVPHLSDPGVDCGRRIGAYRLLEQIGEGGFGVVYMAEQEEPVRRRVAVKIIKLGMDTREVIARFEAERQALAMMEHPNIATILDGGATDSGRPYFVMELVRGIPITEYCDRNRLETRERLELFTRVCHAVQHAHQKGIIHRDLKPSNILITLHDGTPVPKVIDFGIAKATQAKLTEKTLFTRFRQFVGTPLYTSPEQVEMSSLDVDTRADIYSLGVLLFELLTGTTPFDLEELREAGYDEILRVIRSAESPTPSARVRHLGKNDLTAVADQRRLDPRSLHRVLRGDLDWVVMKALEKDRARRYETAAAFARDVERYLSDEPVEAGPPGRWYRLRKFVRRNRVAVLTGVLVALAVLVGLALASYGLLAARRESEIARSEASKATRTVETLEGILRSVDPVYRKRKDYTVKELLDDFAQKGGWESIAEEPEVEIRLRRTLAAAYYGLGEYAAAQLHNERALDLARRELGAGSEVTVRALFGLVDCLLEKGDSRTATKHVEELLGEQEKLLGRMHPLTMKTLQQLGRAKQAGGKYRQAADVLTEVLEWQRPHLGEKTRDTLHTMVELAAACWNQGEYKRAERLFRRALALTRSALGDEDQLVATIASNFGSFLQKESNELDEAEALYREALAILVPAIGEDNSGTQSPRNNLAKLLFMRGRYDEAAEQFERLVRLSVATAGPENPSTLIYRSNLADVHDAQGCYGEAERAYEEIADIACRTLGEEHPDAIMHLGKLAWFYRTRRRFDEAAMAHEALLEVSRRSLGETQPNTLMHENRLAIIFERQGRYEDAEMQYLRILELEERALAKEHRHPLLVKGNLAALYERLGRNEEAEWLLAEVLPSATRTLGDEHTTTRFLLKTLASLYFDHRRFSEAEPLLERIVKADPRDHWHRSLLGVCFTARKRHDEAEPLLLDAYRGIRDNTQATTDTKLAILRNALEYIERRGDPERLTVFCETDLPGPRPLSANAEFLASLARCLHSAGDTVGAIHAMEQALAHSVARAQPRCLETLRGYRREIPDLPTFGSIDAELDARGELIAEGAEWVYHRGLAEPSPGLEWTGVDFDDRDWQRGPSGFGYGDGDDATILSEMRGSYTTLYVRKVFQISAEEPSARLAVRADDGFVAYLNGEEIGRARAGEPGTRLPFDGVATAVAAPEPPAPVEIVIPKERFLPGDNSLAIQGLNRSKDSSDLSLVPVLTTDPRPDGERLEAFREGATGDDAPLRIAYFESRVLQRAGQHAEAAEQLRELVGVAKGAAEPSLRLAESLRAIGDHEGATSAVSSALENGASDHRLWRLWFTLSTGDRERAPEEMLAAFPVEIGEGRSDLAADIHWALGQLVEHGALRLNCGGPEYSDSRGISWSRDRFFAGGNVFNGAGERFAGPIAGTEDDLLYQTERWFRRGEPSSYNIPLPRGHYRVTLHFAELYFKEPKQRVFSVRIEGRDALLTYDPVASVGFATADEKVFDADVEDGFLDVELVFVGSPKISALEVLPVD